MTTTTKTSPIANLASAEAKLAAQIHAVADVVDRIGHGPLATAQRRLKESVQAAKDRLMDGMEEAADDVESLVALMANLAFSVKDDLAHNELAVEQRDTRDSEEKPAPHTQNGVHNRLAGLLGTPAVEEIQASVRQEGCCDDPSCVYCGGCGIVQVQQHDAPVTDPGDADEPDFPVPPLPTEDVPAEPKQETDPLTVLRDELEANGDFTPIPFNPVPSKKPRKRKGKQ